MAGETILHISYDSVLMEVRNGILERGGYRVLAVKGNVAAQEMAVSTVPDLIVIGSGGRYEERLEIATWLLENVRGPRILAMCLSEEEKFPAGVIQFTGDTARDWLLAVESVLQLRANSELHTHEGASGRTARHLAKARVAKGRR